MNLVTLCASTQRAKEGSSHNISSVPSQHLIQSSAIGECDPLLFVFICKISIFVASQKKKKVEQVCVFALHVSHQTKL